MNSGHLQVQVRAKSVGWGNSPQEHLPPDLITDLRFLLKVPSFFDSERQGTSSLESSISPADVGSNDPEHEREHQECRECRDEREQWIEDVNDPRIAAAGPVVESRQSTAGHGGAYTAAQDEAAAPADEVKPPLYESIVSLPPVNPGTQPSLGTQLSLGTLSLDTQLSLGYRFPGSGRISRIDPPMTLHLQYHELGKLPSIDKVITHDFSQKTSPPSESSLWTLEEESESSGNDTDDTIRVPLTRQPRRTLRVLNLDDDSENFVDPRDLERRQSPGLGSPISPIQRHQQPERGRACSPTPESTSGNSRNLARHNAQKMRTTRLKNKIKTAGRLDSSDGGRKGSVDLAMSDSSALEARMARHSKEPLELSSSASTGRIMSHVEASVDAFRWTRPWKRQLLDEPGVWLCHRCEGVLHGEGGRLAQELLRLNSPVQREPGFPIRQRTALAGHVNPDMAWGLAILVGSEALSPTVHASPPRSVHDNGPKPDDDKHAADAAADDVEVVANGGHAVPETALGLCHFLHQRQDLDDANKGGDEDGDGGEDDGVVEDGNDVAGEGLGCVEGHHQGAVGGIEETHAGCLSNWEYEDEPDAGAFDGQQASHAEKSNLGAGVEAEAKDNAQGVHLPRAVDGFEEKPEGTCHEAGTLEVELSRPSVGSVLIVAVLSHAPPLREDDLQPPHQPVQHPPISQAQNDENRRTDGGADDVSHARKAIKALPQRTARGGDDDARHDDNGAVAEREEGADGRGPLARGDEAPGHEVDGGDVVRVEGVTEPERVGEGGGRDEGRVEAQDDGDGGPDDGVDGDEQGDDGDAVGGDAAEEIGLGGEFESPHGVGSRAADPAR
ncbi:Uncharacterized protein TPAR_06978, partial [Tolypocladium paradoxum]